jgi:CHASE2 domain-containing sensor protein
VESFNSNQEAQPDPINLLSAGLGLSGFSNFTADSDDFVRRQKLIEAPSKNPLDPPPARSFVLRIAAK